MHAHVKRNVYTCTRNSCVFSRVRGSELTAQELHASSKIACAFHGQHTSGTRLSCLMCLSIACPTIPPGATCGEYRGI